MTGNSQSNKHQGDGESKLENSLSKEETLSENLPEEFEEVLETLPPDRRKTLTTMLISMQRYSSSPSSPLAKHVNERHIDKLLDNNEQESQRDFEKAKGTLKKPK